MNGIKHLRPDAIIVASALVHGVVVLSHDQKLLTILERETQGQNVLR